MSTTTSSKVVRMGIRECEIGNTQDSSDRSEQSPPMSGSEAHGRLHLTDTSPLCATVACRGTRGTLGHSR
eukprot:1193874-Prorocentrum_minimum.AAC.3